MKTQNENILARMGKMLLVGRQASSRCHIRLDYHSGATLHYITTSVTSVAPLLYINSPHPHFQSCYNPNLAYISASLQEAAFSTKINLKSFPVGITKVGLRLRNGHCWLNKNYPEEYVKEMAVV